MHNIMQLDYFIKEKAFPFFIQYGEHRDDLLLHTHLDFHELTLVLSGSAVHIVNQDRYLLKKGDAFVTGNAISHGFEQPHNFKICNIMYRPEYFWNHNFDIKNTLGFHVLFQLEPSLSQNLHFQNKLQLSAADFESASTVIAAIMQEYRSSLDGRETMLTALFFHLIVLFSRAYCLEADAESRILRLSAPFAFINCHFLEDISMEMLAATVHMSVRHFSRVFHDTYGISPGSYLIQLRIQHACGLMKNQELSISEIAFRSGFHDSNYFSRQFKKMMGYTPKQYRGFLF